MGAVFTKDDESKPAKDLDLNNRTDADLKDLNDKRQTKLKESDDEYQTTITRRKALDLGFRNLGNTCYMSSVLLCLANCPDLTDFVLSPDLFSHINTVNKLGTGGLLTAEFAKAVKRAWNADSERSLSCKDFKSALSSVNSMVESLHLRSSSIGGTNMTLKNFLMC